MQLNLKSSQNTKIWHYSKNIRIIKTPFVREGANNWAIAIGLQHVDGLNVSDILIEFARQEIEGEITMDEAQVLIDKHYALIH